MSSRGYSRRDLFRLFGGRLKAVARRATHQPEDDGSLPWLRPPGWTDRGTEACLECDACLEACPRDSIFKLTERVPGTPAIDPRRAPCVLCDELPCIPACPSGVLMPVARDAVRMGLAEVIPDLCRHERGEPCTDCFIACPLPWQAMVLDREGGAGPRPRIVPDRCTGCGLCAFDCPERPRAIRMVAAPTRTPPTT